MTKLTADDLAATFDAFNRHDVDGVMKVFADDCVFYTVGGAEAYGSKVEGAEAIAKAFSAVWEAMPDAHWDHHSHFVAGDRAVSEWTFSGTGPVVNMAPQIGQRTALFSPGGAGEPPLRSAAFL